MLSPVEKRRFRQYASLQKGEKGYMKLFDLLLEMKSYDEDHIRKELAGDPLLNHLSRYKNYLFNLILKALTAFYKGPDADLSDLIRQVKISVSKRAWPKAFELIGKGRAIAASQERFEEWLNLLKIERRLIMELPAVQNFEKKISACLAELQDVKKKLHNLNDYEDLEDDVFMLRRRKYLVRGEHDRELLTQLADHELMESEEKPLSIRARMIYLQNRFYLSWTKQDFEDSLKCAISIVELLESHAFLMIENRAMYFNRLLQISTINLILKRNEESLKYLDKLGTVQDLDSYERVLLFNKQIIGQISYSSKTGDLRPGLEACKLAKRKLPEYQSNLKPEEVLQIWFWVTKIFIQAEELDQAYSAIQSFIAAEQKGVREDFQTFIRILQLVVLFMQKDWIGLESITRSVKRYIKKKDAYYQFETVLVKFFANAAKYEDRGQTDAKLRELRAEIETITTNGHERAGLQYFDAISWIDGCIEE